MRHIRSSIEIDAPPEDVWELIGVFEHWPSWGPTVVDVASEAERVAPGVTGRVKTIAGPWLPFEITKVEPGRSWTWKVAGVPMTGHKVTNPGPGKALVEFTVPIVLAPYVLVLRRGLSNLKRLAEGSGS